MVGSLYSGLIVLVDWLIKLFVFHKISGLKWEIKKDSAMYCPQKVRQKILVKGFGSVLHRTKSF